MPRFDAPVPRGRDHHIRRRKRPHATGAQCNRPFRKLFLQTAGDRHHNPPNRKRQSGKHQPRACPGAALPIASAADTALSDAAPGRTSQECAAISTSRPPRFPRPAPPAHRAGRRRPSRSAPRCSRWRWPETSRGESDPEHRHQPWQLVGRGEARKNGALSMAKCS